MPRRGKDLLLQSTQPKADMSPMIDLVFLILIFFMIASNAIQFNIDENVEIPTASSGQVADSYLGRIIINVYKDGSIHDEFSRPLTLQEVQLLMAKAKSENANTRLHLRADKGTRHESVKKVMRASMEGGVSDIVYSTFTTEKRR